MTVTSRTYQTAFGFTDEEVRSALAENGLADRFDTVRDWYDGFTFGGVSGVYNPWTITNYLESGGIVDTYRANTSGNALVSNIVRRGGSSLKADFETLMGGGEIEKVIDERVVFQDLGCRRRVGAFVGCRLPDLSGAGLRACGFRAASPAYRQS